MARMPPPPADSDALARIQALTRLARVTAEVGTADTVAAVAEIVTSHVADAVGAAAAALALRDQDEVRLVAACGLSARDAARWESFPFDARTPVSDCIRSGVPLVVTGAADLAARYPGLSIADDSDRTVVTIPLRVTSRSIGALVLSFEESRPLDPAELDVLEILAGSCAQAIQRIEASAEAARQTARLAFLAEASIELASSLDLAVTIARVAQLAVPSFADWCAIDVVRDERIHRLAVAHVDPAKVELAVRLHERWPPDPSSDAGVWRVVRTGQSELVPEVTDDMLAAAAQDEEHLLVARELHLRSALVVPLVVRGHVIGGLTWVSTDEERRYDEDDVQFAEHLARRAATAIDNSELHSQTLEAAVRLQRAVLPERVTGTEAFEVAHDYHPSGRTAVGGDFYDALPLEDGRLVVFIGDVMGRGVSAAAAMSMMRATVRAFASVDPTPSVVMTKLDGMLSRHGPEQLVTLLYALADPGEDTIWMANAGHPPPMLLRRGRPAEQLAFADGPPLGVATCVREQTEVPLRAGDTLVTFTDGLVERRDEGIDAGLERLRHAVGAMDGLPLVAGVNGLVRSLRDERFDDDIAVLGLRRQG